MDNETIDRPKEAFKYGLIEAAIEVEAVIVSRDQANAQYNTTCIAYNDAKDRLNKAWCALNTLSGSVSEKTKYGR